MVPLSEGFVKLTMSPISDGIVEFAFVSTGRRLKQADCHRTRHYGHPESYFTQGLLSREPLPADSTEPIPSVAPEQRTLLVQFCFYRINASGYALLTDCGLGLRIK